MRVSEHFRLGRKQPTLDFVDVDVVQDVPLFLSPRAIRLLPSSWGDECVSLVQHFFTTVLQLIRRRRNEEAEQLLRALREPNETHLGLSRGIARGRALGTESAHRVWQALSTSEAARTGLIEELEDTILMVEGISVDIISDITTNVIRAPLITYTQEQCRYHGIPMEEVDSGPFWDPEHREWRSGYTRLPMAEGHKLLLVPKAIVRKHLEYDAAEYYRHYILDTLRHVELDANSQLVELLKNQRRRVTTKALIEKYGSGKGVIVRESLKRPEILRRYQADKKQTIPPLSHTEIAGVEGTDEPDWNSLLNGVVSLQTGIDSATAYERAVEALLTALFYPVLTNPQVQNEIHAGLKRVDITYTNMASTGFFSWLASHYPAAHVFVECKNYGREVGNPEVDQLAGRFSPSRGAFGLLLCRNIENRDRLLERCRATAVDQHGFIVPLDDSDLRALVHARTDTDDFFVLQHLKSRFDALVM